jgi:hypothetical protein
MSEFTMKPGDMPAEFNTELARDAFDKLVVEMLRALGRGGDRGRHVLKAMTDFIDCAAEASISPAAIIHEQFETLYEKALSREFDGTTTDDGKAIMEASLRVLAEAMADDPAARGRQSQRKTSLVNAIDDYVLSREERSRSRGLSHDRSVTGRLGKWPPPEHQAPTPSTRKKAAPKRKPPDPR